MILHDAVADLRYGLRQFARTPALTVIAVLTLALGIGATTAIFSLFDAARFQTLAVPHPEQLRTVIVEIPRGASMSNVPFELFDELRLEPRSFSGVFAFWRMKMNVDADGESDRTVVQLVSGGYYATLGVPMQLGRAIDTADEQTGGRVAVISHAFWLRRFGADPGAIGRTLYVDGVAAPIVGVTRPGFFGTDPGISPDVTIPLGSVPRLSNAWVTVRLKPEVTDRQGQAEADLALQRALETIRPRLKNYRQSERDAILSERAGLEPGDKGLGLAMRNYVEPLQLLMLLSAAVLLIACVNIANLLLARSVARTQEIGVRLALGASRGRLVRQLLTESALLAATGTTAGVAVAFWLHRPLVRLLMDESAVEALDFSLNGHVLGFTAGMSALTLLLFGVAPAWRGTGVDVWSLVKRDTRGTPGRRLGPAKGLIVAQVASTVVLLFGAGLLVRTFQNLGAVDVGVVDDMLMMRLGFGQREYGRPQLPAVYQDIVSRVEAVPGVVSAAFGWDFAFTTGSAGKSVWVEGQPPEKSQGAAFNVVGPGFFSTAGIPILNGREFSSRDVHGAPKVVIVSDAFARRYFPDQNPVGRHLGDQGAGSIRKYEIIGVVRDTRSLRLRRASDPLLYQPLLQDEWASSAVLHVRTRGTPASALAPVRAAIRAADPKLPIYDVTTLSARRSLALRQDLMMAALSGFFGAAALLLTVIGIYGVIAAAVGQRTTEIGVRMALGATRGTVLWMVVRETVVLIVSGAVLGLPLSFLAAGVLSKTLFGVSRQDPLTAIGCVAVLLAAGCLGGYLPARRAAGVEPASSARIHGRASPTTSSCIGTTRKCRSAFFFGA